ncbi:ribbon-helix-helix protein, CopG family [Chamaesiphon polymorphus]|uniref:Ribbon-helix-helix protein, CopG family n=1 Tax=Chamaesiphon polymorphus CCALA 037 TaxID=2107692 RepID=A0A2T1G6A9_9CYAN|nr:ribbon-helix-helix protein, CopG family [Chamaesiphon polymorphus]PSB52781.1 ribbon-helix-helix protein, CopG family [Chamaesiphon polymorphus CCALA 037]
MSTKKNRLNVSLDPIERQKLEQLAADSGLSLSRTIAQLIRKAKSKPKEENPADS